MPRLARKDLNTPFLHVMVQGVNKEYIFCKNKYIEAYLDIIKDNTKKYTFTIIAYCIMNNHAHFLVYVENINEFGKFMHKVNLLYAQLYNKEENRCGVIFRNRYKVEPIYNTKYLINCIKYIHDNPVKAGMVVKCEDYKYSSYNDYINNCGLTKSKIMNQLFGENCDYTMLFSKSIKKRFMDIDDKDEYEEYILEGIAQFKLKYSKNLIEILSDRKVFKELIFYLKEECGFKYIELQNYFEIPRGTMERLRNV